MVENVHFEMGGVDQCAIKVVTASSSNLSVVISGNKFDRIGSETYSTPILDIGGCSGAITGNVMAPNISVTGVTDWLTIRSGIGPIAVDGNMGYNWTFSVAGSTVASAGLLIVPPVFGNAMPIVKVIGTTTIVGLTFAVVGATAPYAGSVLTLSFADASTVQSGTVGTPGDFILNGRTNFTPAANSTLTVQLTAAGNWQEIGRCA